MKLGEVPFALYALFASYLRRFLASVKWKIFLLSILTLVKLL